MLWEKVPRNRMQSHAHKRTNDEVEQSVRSKEVEYERIEKELCEYVDHLEYIGSFWVENKRSYAVEERLTA